MPTYEYRCDACGHLFEEFQKISDLPIERCPKCKKKKARRQISQGNFILKGGGWYVTDYKTGGGRKAARDKERAEGSSAKSGESKADDTKSSDTKSADTKSGDTKSGDTKSGDTKSSDKSEDKKADAKPDSRAKKAADK